MKNITIAIPEVLYAELESTARAQGLTTDQVIVAAFRLYRAEIQRHRPTEYWGEFLQPWAPVIPEHLVAEIERYRKQQSEQIALETVIEDAVREYLARRERLGGREYRPASRPFQITPVEERDDQGEPDVSINHDEYLADFVAARKLPQSE